MKQWCDFSKGLREIPHYGTAKIQRCMESTKA